MARVFALVVALCVAVLATSAVADLASTNDAKVLNYALTLERLESAFYVAGLAKFNNASFTNVGYPGELYAMLGVIGAHEAQHVAFLAGVLGNAAVPACTYNFTYALLTPQNFLTTAAALETGGQTAYDGAINAISNNATQQIAAQIATVEARHSAYLNEIIGGVPFPQNIDTANTPAAVAALVGPFILSCPYDIAGVLPGIRPSGVALVAGAAVATGILTPPVYTDLQKSNDLAVLNYALTLERLELAFYQSALTQFTATDFTNAGYPLKWYNWTVLIRDHENIHVNSLSQTIAVRGGSAVPACTYNFSSITDVDTFFATARALEIAGQQAYTGAVNAITDTTLQQVAATIATVEARHAAFLNQVAGASPFPDVQDSSNSPNMTIMNVGATGLLTSCPYTIVAPIVIPYRVEPVNFTLSSSGGMGSSASTGMSGMTGMTASTGSMTSGTTGMTGMTGTSTGKGSTGHSSAAFSQATVSVAVAALVAASALFAIVA